MASTKREEDEEEEKSRTPGRYQKQKEVQNEEDISTKNF